MSPTPSRCRGFLLCLLLACGGAMVLGACGPMESPETGEPAAAPVRTATTAQALLVSPEIPLPLSVPGGSQHGLTAASAGDVSLVVWSETDTSGTEDIRGIRVRKSDGSPIDATSFCIACGPRRQRGPAVASNGTDFLVTWDDYQESGYPRMMSVRVRGSDGAVLGQAQVLRDAFPANETSTIASDGSNYLVVWKGYTYSCQWGPWGRQCSYYPNVQGARVSAVDGSSSHVYVPSAEGTMTGQPHVAYGGGTYLVTWSGQASGYSPTNVYAVRLRAWDAGVLDWYPRTVSAGYNPVAAFDGSRFLVIWQSSTIIGASRLGMDGAVLDPGGFLVASTDWFRDYIAATNVIFDGTDYRVVWFEETGRMGYPGPVMSVRVTTEGRTVSNSEVQLGSPPSGGRQALAPLGRGRFLLGYSVSNKPPFMDPPFEYHGKLKVVEDMPLGEACTQDAQCQSGLCVDGVCCDSVCGGGSGNDCQACSVAKGASVDGTCGTVRAQAAVVCRPTAMACDVAETCDGTSLACPVDDTSPSEPELSGDKCEDSPCDVANYLAALGPNALEPSFGQGLLSTARSACASFQSGDTQAMEGQLRALSHQVRAQAGRKLSASEANTLLAALGGLFKPSACVQVQPAAPAPVEPTPVALAQGPLVSPERSVPLLTDPGNQTEVVAASAGDITLVVWSETDAYGYTDIRGVRVRKSDGTLLDTESLCIACFKGMEYEPAVTSNGTDFLVSWTERPDMGGGPDSPVIRAVRLKGSTGAVIQPYMILGTDGPPSFMSSVASDGSDYLVAWYGYEFECFFPPGQQWPDWCRYYQTIVGTRISATAAWNGVTFALASSSYSPSFVAPKVAYGSGTYLVTWTGHPTDSSSSPNVYATRVRASDGVVLDGTPRALASGANASGVAFDGSRFLAVWNTLGGEVRASRMGVDGVVLDAGGFPVGMGNTANVLFDGADYQVAWEQGQGAVRPLKNVRVTREGQVDGAELVLADNRYSWSLGPSARPALALLGPGRLLVGYAKFSDTLYSTRVKLRTVESILQGMGCTQNAQCQSGFCVDGVCCDSACGGGSGNDCQACSVAKGASVNGTCGAVRAEAAVVCRSSAMACDAAETCDGSGLACPADAPGASVPDLTCDKCQDNACDVANYLAWMGPELLLQPIGPALQHKADEACASFQAGDVQGARSHLRGLLNAVRAQSGKKLSTSVANTLVGSITGLLND